MALVRRTVRDNPVNRRAHAALPATVDGNPSLISLRLCFLCIFASKDGNRSAVKPRHAHRSIHACTTAPLYFLQ